MALLDYIKDALGLNLRGVVKDLQEDISRSVSAKIDSIQRNIMRKFVSLFFILLAILFLAASTAFLFIEYFNLSKTISFLVLGIILMFIGLIVRLID